MRKLNALIVDGTASFRTITQELLEKTGFL